MPPVFQPFTALNSKKHFLHFSSASRRHCRRRHQRWRRRRCRRCHCRRRQRRCGPSFARCQQTNILEQKNFCQFKISAQTFQMQKLLQTLNIAQKLNSTLAMQSYHLRDDKTNRMVVFESMILSSMFHSTSLKNNLILL